MIPFSPLARGFLCTDRRRTENATPRTESDSYTRNYYYRDGDHNVYEAVAGIAAKRGLACAQVALAWVLQQPGITAPIFGATLPAHVDEAVAALDVRLDQDETEILEAAYQPRPPRSGGH